MAEQNCWRLHDAIANLQKVLDNSHPRIENHEDESTTSGSTATSNKSARRANVVRECLRTLDLEMDNIALAMEREEQYVDDESVVQLPDRQDLLWIVTAMDLKRLVPVESQCDDYMRTTSLKVCEKAKQFLDRRQLEEAELA